MANRRLRLKASVSLARSDRPLLWAASSPHQPVFVTHEKKGIWCREVLAVSQYRSSVSSVRNSRAKS